MLLAAEIGARLAWLSSPCQGLRADTKPMLGPLFFMLAAQFQAPKSIIMNDIVAERAESNQMRGQEAQLSAEGCQLLLLLLFAQPEKNIEPSDSRGLVLVSDFEFRV